MQVIGTTRLRAIPITPDTSNYNMFVGNTTDVGSYPYSSAYGTFDQSGNVWEWNEALHNDDENNSYRNLRSGTFSSNNDLSATDYIYYSPMTEYLDSDSAFPLFPSPPQL